LHLLNTSLYDKKIIIFIEEHEKKKIMIFIEEHEKKKRTLIEEEGMKYHYKLAWQELQTKVII